MNLALIKRHLNGYGLGCILILGLGHDVRHAPLLLRPREQAELVILTDSKGLDENVGLAGHSTPMTSVFEGLTIVAATYIPMSICASF